MEVEESTCSNFQAIVSVAVDAEGEDVAATVHRFTQIPTQMLMDGCLPRHMNQSLGCFAAYFFGVYDGHGGPQVAPLLFPQSPFLKYIDQLLPSQIVSLEADAEKRRRSSNIFLAVQR